MKYIKLFENWYGDKDKDYNINIDWSKFLIDFEYTFDIVKQINPKLETERDEMYNPHTSEWYSDNYEIFDELGVDENADFNDPKTQEAIYKSKIKLVTWDLKEYMKFYSKYKDSNIPVNRVINVDGLDDIDWNNLGVYWAFDNKHGRDFGNTRRLKVELFGVVESKYVNWLNSLDNYIFFGDSENEIKIKKNSPIFIEKIETKTNKNNSYTHREYDINKTKRV